MLFNLGCGYLGRVMPLTYNLLWIDNISLPINKQIYLINVVNLGCGYLGRVMPLTYNLLLIVNIPLSINNDYIQY